MFDLFKGSSEPEMRKYIDVVGVTHLKAGKKTIPLGFHGAEGIVDHAPETIVLYAIDGVLKTKRFEGTWTLAQVKKWKADKELY